MKLKISAIVVLIGLSLSAFGLGSGRKAVFYAGNEEETPKVLDLYRGRFNR